MSQENNLKKTLITLNVTINIILIKYGAIKHLNNLFTLDAFILINTNYYLKQSNSPLFKYLKY